MWQLAKKLITKGHPVSKATVHQYLTTSFFASFHTDWCFLKADFAKTFPPSGSVPSFYRDQFSFGGIHLCGDKTPIFLTLLTEAESCFETSACFIPAFTIATQ